MKSSTKKVPRDTSNHMPRRDFRCPPELWVAAQQRALEKGETVTDVLRRALERYTR